MRSAARPDEQIIDALDGSANYAGDKTDGLTRAKVLAAFEKLGEADVPDDGERFAIVGWKQWSDLLGIQEFADSDYAGAGRAAVARRAGQEMAGRPVDAPFGPDQGRRQRARLPLVPPHRVGHASGQNVSPTSPGTATAPPGSSPTA